MPLSRTAAATCSSHDFPPVVPRWVDPTRPGALGTKSLPSRGAAKLPQPQNRRARPPRAVPRPNHALAPCSHDTSHACAKLRHVGSSGRAFAAHRCPRTTAACHCRCSAQSAHKRDRKSPDTPNHLTLVPVPEPLFPIKKSSVYWEWMLSPPQRLPNASLEPLNGERMRGTHHSSYHTTLLHTHCGTATTEVKPTLRVAGHTMAEPRLPMSRGSQLWTVNSALLTTHV